VSFDVAAEAYDGLMGRFSRLLSGQMADLASVRAGQRVLDVGCGTGALTGELVERLGPSDLLGS
jgi:ubiquinone/menaquinone biosynthesis C-methylase UbiE